MKKMIHLLTIDKICPNCSYRNKGAYQIESSDVLCCGKCGEFLFSETAIVDEIKTSIEKSVKNILKEEDRYASM